MDPIPPKELKALLQQKVNISDQLRQKTGATGNNEAIIELVYEMQAGNYIAAMQSPHHRQYRENVGRELARHITAHCNPATILEAGTGEATTLSCVLSNLPREVKSHGFDLSWSRTALAKQWLADQGFPDARLCTGSLFSIPFADNTMDVVFTAHAIEANGGREAEILQELWRVARQYVVMLEPAFELASEEARARMIQHGYCRDLPGTAQRLGYEVVAHELFPYSANKLNPGAITILRKPEPSAAATATFACPIYKTPLVDYGDVLFSEEGQRIYPVVRGIPCLRRENAVLAAGFEKLGTTSGSTP